MSTTDQPQKNEMALSQLQSRIGVINRQVGIMRQHIILTSKDFPIAAIIPIADYKKLTKRKE